jgi:hypothetical protein
MDTSPGQLEKLACFPKIYLYNAPLAVMYMQQWFIVS